jgi:hypothetical protein
MSHSLYGSRVHIAGYAGPQAEAERARKLGRDARAANMPARTISFPARLGPQASTREADRAIAAILAEHMTADWLEGLTNGMAPGVVAALRDLEAAAEATS